MENPGGFKSKLKVWVNIQSVGGWGALFNKSDHESSLNELYFAFGFLVELLFGGSYFYWQDIAGFMNSSLNF
ncbi:MAG: hypothetical protein UY42_C0022G0009 [Parcubacteria group bacterium GW2011_GWA2_49_16]|nr:MAG: hypothetical protein UY42_C0022G0009 [Parcubacteria group bacterium GW2011_GWA2_49_16]